MPLGFGAMAGGLSTASVADRPRTGQEVLGQLELAQERELALAEPGGLGASGLRFYLDVVIQQEMVRCQQNFRARNRRLQGGATTGPLGYFVSAACPILHYFGAETAAADRPVRTGYA